MHDANRPIFSIGAVARMLELPPPTIRTWETRYGLVVPERTPGGQRLYSRAQVDQLRFLKSCVANGSRPGEAHRLLAERLDGGRATGGEEGPKVRVVARKPGAVVVVLLQHLLEREGFVIAEDARIVVVSVEDEGGAALSGKLHRDGHRVLALVEEGATAPSVDAVLHLPVAPREVIEATRRLAAS